MRQTYFISDTHFGHDNIIKYCNRPFENAKEMDRVLIRNWNSKVKAHDTIYHIGDVCGPATSRDVDRYLPKLSGKLTIIRGNHDIPICFPDRILLDKIEFVYGGIRYLVVHNPRYVPESFDGWVIHGHTHNHDNKFIDVEKRHVNVSVENIGYTPINIRTIKKKIIEALNGGGDE